ncbi:MAG: response regulator, partial [Methylovulum sp.]|nr:response regulator [Methylovulum sp.]
MPLQKILLCDESQADLASLEQVLLTADCVVLSACTSEEVIRIAKAEKPDAIFMDIAMPGMDGYACCHKLRDNVETSNIPIIFVSSKHQKTDRLYQDKFFKSNRLRLLDLSQYEPGLQLFQEAFFGASGLAALAEQNNKPSLILTLLEALYYFFSNHHERVSESHRTAPAILWEAAQAGGIPWLEEPKKIHATILPNVLSGVACDLQPLVSECKEPGFGVNLVKNALNGRLSLPSPFSANRAYCQESYEVAPDLNCLRFTDGGHTFFLVQLLSSADALYFPVANVFLSFAHINESHIKRLQEKLIKDFAKIAVHATASNSFAGVIASHSRPSHFYYDVWPALFELASSQLLLDKLPAIIMRKDHDFNDADVLFACHKRQVLDSHELDRIAFDDNKWFVHIGRQQHLSNRFAYDIADRYLVDKMLQSPTDTTLAKPTRLADCYPVVWIGVEGQKRC